ncbi:MAG: YHS domain-containing protein [Acidobacteriota bacterium]
MSKKELTMTESESATKDPICGMTVSEATAIHEERDGKTYYFCSDGCRQRFLATSAGGKAEDKTGGCCG